VFIFQCKCNSYSYFRQNEAVTKDKITHYKTLKRSADHPQKRAISNTEPV